MAMKDTFNYTGVKLAAFKVYTISDGPCAYTGYAVDLSGFKSALFSVTGIYSALDAATYTLSLMHSDDGSTYTAATGDFIVGPSAVISGAANVQKIAYIGSKRYVKLIATPSVHVTSPNTITITGHAILQNPGLMPAA